MPLELLARSLERNPGRPAAIRPPFRRAAVAAVFRPGPDLLFIRRTTREGDPWSGHMAFPGGRVDPGDSGARDAVIREAMEELGLELGGARPLGVLDEVITPPRVVPDRMVVTPFVFAIGQDPVLRPNDEVAAVHWFALARFVSGEGRGTMEYDWNGMSIPLPCVRLDGTLIWGMTLRALDDMLGRMKSG